MKSRLITLCLAVVLTSPVVPATRTVVLLHTNDFESALDPIRAFWMEGSPLLGGAPALKTMIDQIRRREASRGRPVFLFDSGDMFTGMLSRVTHGEILFEMMISFGYDAMGMGNHEFDYGSENFLQQSFLAPFPVLSVNAFYRSTEILYMQPHAIVEKDGFRIGVIGLIGRDAMSVVVPSLVSDLEFRDPEPYLRRSVEYLSSRVDLIVVLAHQGKTGPMQSDAEARTELQRDFDEDVALTTAVPGIDVFLGGHAHRGIEPPWVNPETGTIISQTYGHGTRLGYLEVEVDTTTGSIVSHRGELLKTYTADYAPDPLLAQKIATFKEKHRNETGQVVGRLDARLTRLYNEESRLGSFTCDVLLDATGADVAFMNAGGLRADLPEGEVTNGNIRDALPFLNSAVTLLMTGAQIREVLEQSFRLERGMMQVAGLTARYDLRKPVGQRLVDLTIRGEPVQDRTRYLIATNSFVAEGGDLYSTFQGLQWESSSPETVAQLVIRFFENSQNSVPVAEPGRLLPLQP